MAGPPYTTPVGCDGLAVGGGAAGATVLWILGSIAFTIYVSKVGSYDKTYGSLGGVIILLLWFYLTAYVILFGAELNAEIGRQRPAGDARSLAADSGTGEALSAGGMLDGSRDARGERCRSGGCGGGKRVF